MIIYHHENMHYEMILLIWFVVIDNSPDVDEDLNTGVNMDSMSAVHDDSGNPLPIVLSYQICISCTRDHNIVTKKDCRWFVYDDMFKSFLILLSSRNCL